MTHPKPHGMEQRAVPAALLGTSSSPKPSVELPIKEDGPRAAENTVWARAEDGSDTVLSQTSRDAERKQDTPVSA